MAGSRTVYLVLILNLIGHYCDTIDSIQTEPLLRGSSEHIENEETPVKDIEPEKTLREELKKQIEVTKEDATTESVAATTNAEFVEMSQDEDVYSSTEAGFSTDSNVYKTEEVIDNATYDKTETTTSTTTSTSTSTTKAVEDNVAGPTGFEDNNDFSPRAPKLNGNPEPKQQASQSSFEVKPITTASMTKSSTLKGWLEDSWLRPPAGILVPLRPMALNRALAVWNDLTVEGLNVSDIVIVGYDSNGVNWRSRHSLQPTSSSAGQKTVGEALSKLLLKYQDVNTDTNSDGTMRALASAAKLVPYDSALFVITDKGPGDVQRLPLALRALVEKRLKVYTIWTDPTHPSEESEKQLQGLKNVSRHTEGDVLPYSLQVMDMENSRNLEAAPQHWALLEPPHQRKGRVNTIEEEKLDTLLVRRGGGEAISLGVPVENGVTALRIYIEGLVEHAVLYPPNDAPQIDLYNETAVMAFSPKSRTEGMSPRDLYLVFPGADTDADMLSVLPMKPPSSESPAPTVGVWHLSVRCDTCDYRLCVAATTHIHFRASIAPKDMLKIRVVGPVASVRESVLIDEYGSVLATLPFSYQPVASDGQEMPHDGPPAELMADVALPSVKGSRIYAKIVGRDIRGEPFVRLSGPLNQQEVRMGRSAAVSFPDNNDLDRAEEYNAKVYNERLQYNETSILPNSRASSQVVNQRGSLLTSVQIGLSTRLYGAPGDSLQLHFDVTNYREQAVRFTFEAVGQLRFLRGINTRSQVIGSGQTANVIVSVGITSNAQPGATDLITFTATGVEAVSISALVYVTNNGQSFQDVWAPELRHNFQGSCWNRMGGDCAQYAWSATIIAKDANSGLLRLTSSPIGLVYDSNFVAGSREEVVSVYRATCCAPRVMITAIDAFGNANSYVVDISNYITEAGIAAIVLGVFLFIALVVVIVLLIYWCVKRRRESKELSYVSSTSRNLS